MTRWFAAFAWSLAFWALTLIGFRAVPDLDIAAVFLRMAYISAICIAASLSLFMHYFPEAQPFGIVRKLFFTLSALAVGIFLMLPGTLITDVRIENGVRAGTQTISGYNIFTAYFVFYYFGALYLLYKRWRTAVAETRTHISYIIWSVLFLGLFGVFFNLILPSPWIHEWRFTWVGPIFSTIVVFSVAYAIAKYRLMDVRILAAELLTITIVFLLFTQIFFGESARELLTHSTFFVLAAFFGWFLIRSIRREAKQREELARLTIELERANAELKKIDQRKSEFLSLASHQLRTPLTAIKGYASMLLEGSFGAVSETLQKPLDTIFKSSDRLVRIIEDFLTISRIEQNRLVYTFATADLRKIVSELAEDFKQAAEARNLAFSFAVTDEGDYRAQIDEGKIVQVISNVIDNALKYTPRGSVAVTLGMTDGKTARVCVKDTGVGMDEETKKIIFEKFTRAKDANAVSTTGTGLGLYVAHELITAHKGRIWVESGGKGKGSTFCIELPLMSM